MQRPRPTMKVRTHALLSMVIRPALVYWPPGPAFTISDASWVPRAFSSAHCMASFTRRAEPWLLAAVEKLPAFYNPAWEGAVPGIKAFVVKADRGENKGSYAIIMTFDSERTRDLVVPTEGGGISETSGPLLREPNKLNARLSEFVESGWMGTYTDYVVLR